MAKNYSVEFWKIILCLLSMCDRYMPSQNVGNKYARLTPSHQRNAFCGIYFSVLWCTQCHIQWMIWKLCKFIYLW